MIVEPTLEQVLYVARNMEQVWRDEREWQLGYFDPEEIAWTTWRQPGIKYACVDADGLPVMCSGMNLAQPGVAHTWAFGCAGWERHLKEIAKASRAAVRAMLDSGQVHRVQMITGAARESADKWIRLLGLRYEHTLERYGKDGQDFHIYSALAEGGS